MNRPISNCKKQMKANRQGATSVEFAFMVPVIFLMFIGAIELTRLNFIRQTAANACYEGARKAITPGGTDADARTEALRIMTLLGVGNGATATVATTDTTVNVSVSIPVNQNSWGISRFSSGLNVTQSCMLTKEQL